ncbi:hypothetical protein HR060_01595 [Catenovulum sp. SM1970]|uniref:hypothetical protein n=1 Tax=Marinifaba aquimaris TaxID=2741323 RepID=UPI0015727A74|nr:hypothetical protein [Marinifaba aquimaris]NTS75547.1 hypothetical protein [Marinifaba aquimaris]
MKKKTPLFIALSLMLGACSQTLESNPDLTAVETEIKVEEPEVTLGQINYENNEQLKYQTIKVKLTVKDEVPADFKALRAQAREEALFIAAKAVNSYENESLEQTSTTEGQITSLAHRSLGDIMAISKIQQQSCFVLGVAKNTLHLSCETVVDVPVTITE